MRRAFKFGLRYFINLPVISFESSTRALIPPLNDYNKTSGDFATEIKIPDFHREGS